MRENVTGRLCRTREEIEIAEREFLDKLTPEDRIEPTWQLSQVAMGMEDLGCLPTFSTSSARPFTISFLDKSTLIQNKRATARPKDFADLDSLEKD